MGATVSSFCKDYGCLSSRRQYRVLIDGISPAGKTSLLYKLKFPEDDIVTTIPTIGFNVESFDIEGIEITGWDIGGRDKMRPLIRHYYPNTDAMIYMVDSTESSERLEYSRDQFHMSLNEEELRGTPILLLCNKQDLPNAKSPAAIAEFFGVADGREHLDHLIMVQGCSVLENDGIQDGMEKLHRALELTAKTDQKRVDANEPQKLVREKPERSRKALTKDGSFVQRSNNVCVKRFETIKHSTECPFAKSAKVWGGNALFHQGTSIEQQAQQHVEPLIEFTERSNKGEPLDAFCIEIEDELARKGSPEDFGKCVRRMLVSISDMDPSSENCMRVRYVGSKGWRFRFNRTDFFVTTFAPCYPETSSRYAFGSDRAFVLLQPELSFERHNLPFDSAHTNWDEPETIRDKTRIAYRIAGRGYHIPTTTKYAMADHIVKPLKDDGHSVIQWWIDEARTMRFE